VASLKLNQESDKNLSQSHAMLSKVEGRDTKFSLPLRLFPRLTFVFSLLLSAKSLEELLNAN
jgi:hypothetical protein